VKAAAWLANVAVIIGGYILMGVVAVAQAAIMAAAWLVALGPIGLLIAAIVAIVAALVWFFTQTELGKELWAAFVQFITDVWNNFVTWIVAIVEGFPAWWNGIWTAVGQFIQDAWNNFITFITDAWNGFVGWLTGIIDGLVSWWNGIWTGIGNFIRDAWNFMVAYVKAVAIRIVVGLMTKFAEFTAFWSNLWNNIKTAAQDIWNNVLDFFKSIPGKIKGFFEGAGKWLYDIGSDVVQGLLDGISSLAGTIGSFFLNLLPGWIRGPFEAALGIASPSKVFEGYGKNIVLGLVKGLDQNAAKAGAAIERIAAKIRDTKGMSDPTKSRLITYVKEQGKALVSLWKAYDRSADKLKKANEDLDKLRAQRKQMIEQIAGNISGGLSLTQDEVVEKKPKPATTFAQVAARIAGYAAKAKTFAKVLKDLRKAGIPEGLLQEIAGLGVKEGTDVGKAILSGSKSQIKELSGDYMDVQKYATSAGRTVADEFFAVGIKAQEGVVKGLTSDTAKLKKAAQQMARSIANYVRKELGIHSPSRVFMDLGKNTMLGYIKGIEAMTGKVQSAATAGMNVSGTAPGLGSARVSSTAPAYASTRTVNFNEGAFALSGADPYAVSLLTANRIAEKVAI
jgi:hypothetical protein